MGGICSSENKNLAKKGEKASLSLEPKELFTYDNMYKLFQSGKTMITDKNFEFVAFYPPDKKEDNTESEKNINAKEPSSDVKNKKTKEIPESTAFIEFGYIKGEGEFNSDLEGGWKIQVRVDDNDQANLAKAWDIVKNVIIDEKLSKGKVVKKGENLQEDKEQSGKQITIYQFFDPNRDWLSILNRLENDLTIAQIKAANISPSTKAFPNSSYLSYRNDVDKNGKYIPAKIAGNNYNPGGHADIFKDIIIALPIVQAPTVAEAITFDDNTNNINRVTFR